MNDICQVKVLNFVEVQENGIIRNSQGRIIARLVDSVDFDSEHLEQTKPLSNQEILKFIHEKFVMFGFEADYIVDDNELIDFAKAIEERHGIK